MAEIHDPRGATLVVAASDSLTKSADYRCDGTADEVQIQAALDALPATGGKCLLLDGTYNLNGQITLDDNQVLEGLGPSTILKLVDSYDANIDMIVNADQSGGNTNIVIRNLTVDANEANQSSGNNLCLDFTKVSYFEITGCYFINGSKDGGSGNIYFNTCDHSRFHHNVVKDGNASGIYLDTVTDAEIDHNTVTGFDQAAKLGILITACTTNTISGNVVEDNQTGIGMSSASDENTISGNTVRNSGGTGIDIDNCDRNTISNNVCEGNGSHGISCHSTSYRNVIIGNSCCDNTSRGILFGADYNAIIGNACIGNTIYGIGSEVGDYVIIQGNYCYLNGREGINLYLNDHCSIQNNYCMANSQTTDNTYANIKLGTCTYNLIQDNICRQGTETNQPDYGLELDANCNNNRIRWNDLYDSGQTGNLRELSTGNFYSSYVVPFSSGSEPLDSGYLIDAGTEFARAWARLPEEVLQVVRMKIYARSVVAEVHSMCLEINVNGGADNEAFNAHATAVATALSTTTNFAADDIIEWTRTDVNILALTGGDSIEVKVLHEPADNDDCETDAYIRTVEFEYI